MVKTHVSRCHWQPPVHVSEMPNCHGLKTFDSAVRRIEVGPTSVQAIDEFAQNATIGKFDQGRRSRRIEDPSIEDPSQKHLNLRSRYTSDWQEDRAVAAGGRAQARFAGGGKSELRRAVCRITSGTRASRPVDGQCHRKDTASANPPSGGRPRNGLLDSSGEPNTGAGVRVKWCGKSAPLRR